MEISIVIPTYNSELIIEELVSKIFLVSTTSFEIIVVNDKSKDNTFEKLNTIKKNVPNLKIINLKENIGQVGATILGIRESQGDIIITMDDDLQHNPKHIESLIKEIQNQNSDFVIAKWGLDETISRNLSSYFFSIISSTLVFKSINFRNTAFRAFKKEYKEEFVSFFISRYWIDPRRLKARVSQITTPHENQNFRPYSSFQSRVTLALKHLLFDSYLVQFFIVLLFFKNFFLLGLLLIVTLMQYLIRYSLRKRRLSAI